MQARFLLGPAGSGKTHRCLAGIRAELISRPDGPPLVLLAPKQATFQLERQLLADNDLTGYTRLRILSFERLADFVLDTLGVPQPERLSEEGRLMVLRALLAEHVDQLGIFRASARLPGFAQQLHLLLRDLQHHRLLPRRLETLAGQAGEHPQLQSKLRDLSRLLGAYLDWLRTHRLQDTDGLLDFAADALGNSAAPFQLGGLWLDGFAEMTPQELRLLTAVLPRSHDALLAFCLPEEPRDEVPWLSAWSVVSQTFRACLTHISALPDVEATVEVLLRDPTRSRFGAEPALAHLEAQWTEAKPWLASPDSSVTGNERAGGSGPEDEGSAPSCFGRAAVPRELPVRLVSCRDREIEATVAAHEILRHVRERGGRYRDCAVLLRSLEGYHDVLRRVFSRRDIPFFLDRRESVSHHPLAELTRFSVRLASFGWLHDDWFGALKTGLVNLHEAEVDRLENVALEFGWEGDVWRGPLRANAEPETSAWAEALRHEVIPPFLQLSDRLRGEVTGRDLAAALRELWIALRVDATLEAWSGETPDTSRAAPATHLTLWEQMQGWLENLELAFPAEAMRASEWLPILEAGLANLTVGVIPPALDQVLIGTVDRSRNPELQLVILPGFNESVFPTPGPPAGLFTEPERDALATLGAPLGPGARRSIGHERYYGYIACTRARSRLVVTHARRDGEGHELHPSVFVGHLERLFPSLVEDRLDGLPARWQKAEHVCELVAPLLRKAQASEANLRQRAATPQGPRDAAVIAPDAELASLLLLPGLERARDRFKRLPSYPERERLASSLAEALYLEPGGETRVFPSSVSRLELFAACPFRFFVEAGLRAEERKRFEVDQRERGTLQHEVLERFHHEIARSGRRWRDVPPEEAVTLIGRLVDESAATYREGLFVDDERNQFTAATLKDALQRFVRTVIGWMRSYQLDPAYVELRFGMGQDSMLPAWRIPLEEGRELALRGKVDRVDLSPSPEDTPWCVVVDYKSGPRKLDALLMFNGLQLQLPAYLAAIDSFAHTGLLKGCRGVRPAGVFYVNLRGTPAAGDSREEVLGRDEAQRAAVYRHYGRFNAAALAVLDANAATTPSGQFNFKLKRNGQLGRQQADPLDPDAFNRVLADVATRLKEFGQRILSGEAAVDPYRHGGTRACDRCDLGAVCRIEARTHRFRPLAAPPDTPDCSG